MSKIVLKRSFFFSKPWNKIRYSTTVTDAKSFESIPGLSSLPVLGPIHHFIPGIGSIGYRANFFELSKALHEKFGNIVKLDGIFARASMVILYEPEHFDQVYRSEDIVPSRPGFDTLVYYRTILRKSTYDGIYGLTTAQGAQWRDFRTKVNPALLKPKLVKLYTPTLEKIADDMVCRLKKFKDDSYLQQNFDLEMTKWSLESVGVIALGERLGCFNETLSEDEPASVLMKCSRDIIELSYKLEFGPSLWKYFPTRNFKKLIKTFDMQWNASVEYINKAKRRLKERDHNVLEEDKSVLEKLLAIDEKVAVGMANEMLLAGIDTVAFTTTCLLYNLARNPHVQEKLREEIQSEEQSSKYLRACLKESLRLFAVIPANLRRTTKKTYGGWILYP